MPPLFGLWSDVCLPLRPTQHTTLLTHVQPCTYGRSTPFSFTSLDCFWPWMYSSDNSDNSSEVEEQRHQQVRKMMSMAAFTLANIIATAALIYANPLYNKLPYHTSAFCWLGMGINQWPSWMHPQQARGPQAHISCPRGRVTAGGVQALQTCLHWRAACHFSVHLCYWSFPSACLWTLPTFRWHSI